MLPSSSKQPERDELEISVFGPGVGECIVVHLGQNEWMIVDSCINRSTKRSVALDYLNQIGVNLDNVKLVIISHWHDDHIRGISQVVEATPNARIVFSAALQQAEFKTLIKANRDSPQITSATKELWQVLAHLEDRRNSELGHFSPTFASSEKRLYLRDSTYNTEIWSLSPSSSALFQAFKYIGHLLPSEGYRARKPPPDSANQFSVVISVEVNGRQAILGSDLEMGKEDSVGWQAIVCSATRPRFRAQFFKVPHHGSETGYCEEVWRDLLVPNPWAVLTPMRRSKLPTVQDICILKEHTDKIWCTAPADPPSKPRRENIVEKEMSTVATKRRVLEGPMGHVIFRASLLSPDSKPQVIYEAPAARL